VQFCIHGSTQGDWGFPWWLGPERGIRLMRDNRSRKLLEQKVPPGVHETTGSGSYGKRRSVSVSPPPCVESIPTVGTSSATSRAPGSATTRTGFDRGLLTKRVCLEQNGKDFPQEPVEDRTQNAAANPNSWTSSKAREDVLAWLGVFSGALKKQGRWLPASGVLQQSSWDNTSAAGKPRPSSCSKDAVAKWGGAGRADRDQRASRNPEIVAAARVGSIPPSR